VPGVDAGQTMLDRVAAKLGIDSVTLRDAIESSASDEIDERVAAGELTQEQADAMKERLADAPENALIGGGFRHGHGPGGGGHFCAGEELATFLGITQDELRTELQADGATLATVAEAHGKSRDDLKAFLMEQFTAKLDERVAAGDLTQEEADARLAEKTANLDAIIDGTMPFGRGFRGDPPPGMMPDDVPSDDTTPQTTPSTTPSSSGTSTS
jgi:polyhydroxyalkanoate synthesis regulator phasin